MHRRGGWGAWGDGGGVLTRPKHVETSCLIHTSQHYVHRNRFMSFCLIKDLVGAHVVGPYLNSDTLHKLPRVPLQTALLGEEERNT